MTKERFRYWAERINKDGRIYLNYTPAELREIAKELRPYDVLISNRFNLLADVTQELLAHVKTKVER